MKRTICFLLIFSFCFVAKAQKKSKGKVSQAITDSMNYAAPVKKSGSKKGKNDKKLQKEIQVNYAPERDIPLPDSSKKFTGVIKYRITSDDPADQDSVFVVFGENRFRVTMFIPGYRADQIFEKNKTYKTEKLGARNAGTEFSLAPDKRREK